MQKVAAMEKNRKLLPKFVVKEMESLFLEELRSSINLLMANLESLPVSKGTTDSKYGLRKFKRYNNRLVWPIQCLWARFSDDTVLTAVSVDHGAEQHRPSSRKVGKAARRP